MPETEQVLHPSRRKWSLVLLGAVAGAILAWWIFDGWLRWTATAFLAMGVLGAVAMLIPGVSCLRLTPDGFTIHALRSNSYRWSDVKRFKVGYVGWKGAGRNRVVAFDFADDFDRHSRARRAASWLAGHEGAFTDTYGLTCEELAALLNRYRDAGLQRLARVDHG